MTRKNGNILTNVCVKLFYIDYVNIFHRLYYVYRLILKLFIYLDRRILTHMLDEIWGKGRCLIQDKMDGGQIEISQI
jgi:hypothetical protein